MPGVIRPKLDWQPVVYLPPAAPYIGAAPRSQDATSA
jgi:hypothetical protein